MKQFIILIALFAVMLPVMAQLTPEGAFTSAPASVFPLIDKNTRLDMVDYYKSGLSTPSSNRLDGHSVITALTPTSLSAQLSDASTAQLVLLKAGNDTIIALVNTVATPGLDSTLKFYSSDWKPLPVANYFKAPTWDDWVASGHSTAEVTAYTPFMLASYEIEPESGVLKASNNLSTFLDPDIYTLISTALRPSLTYTWNGKRFNRN